MTANGEPDLVGTSEAAAILEVEKPRIGRYMQKGRMPRPVCVLGATPVWRRSDIEALREILRANRAGEPSRPLPSPPRMSLVGTREAADLLGVERTRIGRWLRHGRMPEPLVRLRATPVWRTRDIAALRKRVDADRRERAPV